MTRFVIGIACVIFGLSVGSALLAQAPATGGAGTRAAAPAAQAGKAVRPTGAVDPKSCVTAECHVDVKKHKVVHGPVNVNACDACHTVADAGKHTFSLARDKKDLCTFCHKVETKPGEVVHKPVSDGDCLGCHDPHGGKTNKFTRGANMKELCASCHTETAKYGGKKYVHGPVAAGVCESCHGAHSAKFPKLLTTDPKDLCQSCHKEMTDQLKKAKVRHKPVMTGECSGCHNPHASDFVAQTNAAPKDLCITCHEDVKKTVTKAANKHSVVMEDQACLNCHTSHGSSLARLMKKQPADVCMSCHDKAVKTPDGRTVSAVLNVKDQDLVKHGPLKDGTCERCHNAHGSDQTRLLTKPYPETFYEGFKVEKYDLCFSCHDKKLVQAEEAGGLTGFRNGKQNLHFVHVNKEDRGRSCRACHETHASKQPMHVRESVPYGKWEMPINFKKSEDGGSCSPGCHKPYDYNRKTPVDYKAGAATQSARS